MLGAAKLAEHFLNRSFELRKVPTNDGQFEAPQDAGARALARTISRQAPRRAPPVSFLHVTDHAAPIDEEADAPPRPLVAVEPPALQGLPVGVHGVLAPDQAPKAPHPCRCQTAFEAWGKPSSPRARGVQTAGSAALHPVVSREQAIKPPPCHNPGPPLA
jgi:hypothetical protein